MPMPSSQNERDQSRPPEEANAGRRALAQALAKGGMTSVHVVGHETAQEVLTPRRIELLRTIEAAAPDSVRGLARLVDRDPGQVSRELETLAANNLIAFEENGRSKRPVVPHEQIVREPYL